MEFKFPDVGEGIHEGEVVKWRVKEGDVVKEHDVIVDVETDKAVVEIPSPAAGRVIKIHHQVGEKINVGDVLATIGEASETAKTYACSICNLTFINKEQLDAHTEQRHKEGAKPGKYTSSVVGFLEEAPPEEETTTTKPSVPAGPHALATPAIRKLARDLNVDINQVKGTGPEGRVTETDVRNAARAPRPAASGPKVQYEKYGRVLRVAMSATRKAIAKHMVEAAYTAPHVVAMDDADVTQLWAIREKEKKVVEPKGIHLTFLPFIIKAVVASLKKHPHFNASLDEATQEMVFKKYYNIGVAVHTSDGLMVPVVKNADAKSITEIAKEVEDLAEKARARTISLEDLKGQSFTITNYGSIGGTYGVPIINYPDVAILGLGRIDEKPVAKDGKVVIRKIIPLSLSFDHRVVDGAQAAMFLQEIIMHLEDPALMLVD